MSEVAFCSTVCSCVWAHEHGAYRRLGSRPNLIWSHTLSLTHTHFKDYTNRLALHKRACKHNPNSHTSLCLLLTFSHIVVVREEAVVVERRGGVSVFAHQQGWGERPSPLGSVVVADWWWRGWWGCRPAQRPCCCSPTLPQHRGTQPSILIWGEDGRRAGRGVGQSRRRDGRFLGVLAAASESLTYTCTQRVVWRHKLGWKCPPCSCFGKYVKSLFVSRNDGVEETGGMGGRDEQKLFWWEYLQCCCFCNELKCMDTHTDTPTFR